MTSMWDDEKVSRLVAAGGVEGLAAFGVYCRVLDIVASQMDSRTSHCAVTYSVTRWSLLLSLRANLVRHWFEKLVVTHLLEVEWVGSEIRVTIPKLLKYRDEYSKKSGQTPEQRTEQNRTEGEGNKEQSAAREIPVREIVNAIRYPLNGKTSQRWEDFLRLYPLKVELDDASRQFVSVVSTENEGDVFACLERYRSSDQVARGAVMKPANWLLTGHRDKWLSDWPKPPETPEERKKRRMLED